MDEASRLESAIAALLPYRELIDSGAPMAIELHFHQAEIKVTVRQFASVKIGKIGN